jgi:hypothetical protein
MSNLHDAALRAGVWQVIEQRAKALKDAAKAELQALEVGDTVAGKVDGQVVAKATKTSGREKIVVTDERALLEWVKREHPSEVVEAVNPAYVRSLDIVDGHAIDAQGGVVPGVEVHSGEPYVMVRRGKDAEQLVAELFTSGRLSLDGIRSIEAETIDG